MRIEGEAGHLAAFGHLPVPATLAVVVIELDELVAAVVLRGGMGDAGVAPAPRPAERRRNLVSLIIFEEPEPLEHRRERGFGPAEFLEQEVAARTVILQKIVELRPMAVDL